MAIGLSLLTIIDEGPTYGLRLKQEFEARTGGVWPLNVGQVYATLARLERRGLVRPAVDDGDEGHKVYEITTGGRAFLDQWFARATDASPPARDELVLKLVMGATHGEIDPAEVIQVERKNAVQLLQEYTRLKRQPPADSDLGWLFLLDFLIFETEARVRWLDACEARLGRRGTRRQRRRPAAGPARPRTPSEVTR